MRLERRVLMAVVLALVLAVGCLYLYVRIARYIEQMQASVHMAERAMNDSTRVLRSYRGELGEMRQTVARLSVPEAPGSATHAGIRYIVDEDPERVRTRAVAGRSAGAPVGLERPPMRFDFDTVAARTRVGVLVLVRGDSASAEITVDPLPRIHEVSFVRLPDGAIEARVDAPGRITVLSNTARYEALERPARRRAFAASAGVVITPSMAKPLVGASYTSARTTSTILIGQRVGVVSIAQRLF